jgi:DNA invertase Pin-like site-specific DNA recombinase
VLIIRQYAYRGTNLVVIPQPDGSVACIPAWMTDESAAQHKVCVEPRLSLDVLRALRAQIDAVLGFLRSDSTADQLVHNQESRQRQYGLADRAKQLGWATIEVVDDDLGRSGGGITRPGFERLLAAICEGRVGAVFAIEASRLARNGRDWHTLIEFCGLVGTVIVDENGIYDPRHSNDRLLLGMKGTMSELELSLFRQRSQEALKQKARRGALFLGVAAGYVKTGRDRIEKDPDQRVQDALRLVFAKFAELQSR